MSPNAFSLRRDLRRAFSMMEILIVLAILGLLATLVINNFEGVFQKSEVRVAGIFVKSSIKVPLQTYRMDMGGYPSGSEGLKALVAAPASRAEKWGGPYLEDGKLPLDPWGEEYQYRFPGVKNKGSYDVWSKGPDKTDGTPDDIGNW